MYQTNILLESGTNELEIVEFFIHEQIPGQEEVYTGYYGINVAKVLKIIKKPKITELPEVPHPAVLGAFNLRSSIIPLVDLSLWLGKNRILDENANVIVTEFNKVVNGFLVSGVTRIHRLSWEDVEPPSNYVAQFSSNSITGVVKLENRITFLIDLEKIVAELNPNTALNFDKNLDVRLDDNYTALVADDSDTILEMLANLLEQANFKVIKASNGLQAWEKLQELKKQAQAQNKRINDLVQIVVSDIEMPAMDGLTLTKKIKQDPELATLPVLLFSSLITERIKHKGESVGADDQISKPEVSELAIRAKTLIEKTRGGK
ncbi:chemotaxis protein CheV [Desulfohalobiaceae bacterium Ax17]|uniref:chemotaxis protein n=1 Tax=Desulfovulcanus ferrireducens TaxID=2831190 RepID=UPI00207BCE7F|nr:chemotaxis protein [Desulfovulcanus ferrireducens]MBT8764413.1 chemotaxis protein CheV [Desulfovulcanus ferrireducens]